MRSQATVRVPTAIRAALHQGHPWVYRDQIEKPPALPDGAWVRVVCGDFQAYGLWDNQGPIAVRVYARRQRPDAEWVARRVRTAWETRAPLRRDGRTNAFRWIFGEGDGLPGIVVDLYGDYAVVQRYAPSTAALLPWLLPALSDQAPLKGIVERSEDVAGGEACLQVLWGQQPPRELVVYEHGLAFLANLYQGQKTGLFLDHRENRRLIEDWSAGRRVLNGFGYTGAFSVYALRGGARQVTTCDVAAQALADAQRNFQLNGFDPEAHVFLACDVFDLLERYKGEGRRFDLLILDPPSFARAKKDRFAALRAYTKLNALALRCVAPGGLLATASCTSQVSPEAFRAMLADAGVLAGRRVTLLHDAGQPADHPVPAGFTEGRYLKFLLARVEEWP